MLLRRLAWLWIIVHAEEMENKLSISIWYSSIVSRVLRHKRIKLSLAKWIKIMIFKPHQSFRNSTGPYQWRRLIFIGKNCDEYWEPIGKEGVSPKVFPRVFPRNHELILRNKKKNKQNRDWNIRTTMKDRKIRWLPLKSTNFHVYILRILLILCNIRYTQNFLETAFTKTNTRLICTKFIFRRNKYTEKKCAAIFSFFSSWPACFPLILTETLAGWPLIQLFFFSFFFGFEVVWHLSVAHLLKKEMFWWFVHLWDKYRGFSVAFHSDLIAGDEQYCHRPAQETRGLPG